MQTDIQARGFMLTEALLQAAQAEAQAYRARFPRTTAAVSIRLYDVNGLRGGPDKGCLASAHIGKHRVSVVASDVDTDMYTAIRHAFAKLQRATRTALTRARTLRRKLRRPALTRSQSLALDQQAIDEQGKQHAAAQTQRGD